MRHFFVILGILFIGFIYARVDKSDEQVCTSQYEESSISNIPDKQQSVIRDYLFINSECEIFSPIGNSSVSRIPTRTLQHNVFQRFLLFIKQQDIETNLKVFQLRSTTFLKRQPLSKNYYIYYLSRITC